VGPDNVLRPSEIVRLFRHNVTYFFIGRHFGLVPYLFPGVLAVLLWLASSERSVPWRVATFIGVATAALALLILLPYTWFGGGGPPGNRYFLNVYPAMFFLTPPLGTAMPALLAWIGGALFTAKMVINPFYAAKFTYETTQRGWARRLPVELTVPNDLPIRLDTSLRARILYGHDPWMFLYFLDQHAYPPEPEGMWIAGTGRADIIVRTVDPIDHFIVTAKSPIRTVFTVSAGAGTSTVQIEPGTPKIFTLAAAGGVRGHDGYALLLTAQSSEGFTPRLQDPGARDDRNLGVQMHLQVVSAAAP
jgi:hypothetical protein